MVKKGRKDQRSNTQMRNPVKKEHPSVVLLKYQLSRGVLDRFCGTKLVSLLHFVLQPRGHIMAVVCVGRRLIWQSWGGGMQSTENCPKAGENARSPDNMPLESAEDSEKIGACVLRHENPVAANFSQKHPTTVSQQPNRCRC